MSNSGSADNSDNARFENDNRAPAGQPSSQERAGSDMVSLPRWVVYFQAALLGIIATTFFVLGMMVGNLTAGAGSAAERVETTVTGVVSFEKDGVRVPDNDAVVLILPANRRPDERSKADIVHPMSFQPLDNPGIDRVHSLGGAVVRAGSDGRFRVVVDGPQKFNLLVVSRNAIRESGDALTKEQMAAVATFFIPVEDAVGQQKVFWSTFQADQDVIELPAIGF